MEEKRIIEEDGKMEEKKKPDLKVIQDSDPMPIEIMAEHIRAISEGIKKLRSGPLTEKALILLIQHATPYLYTGGRVNVSHIKVVLEGIESLEKKYLK